MTAATKPHRQPRRPDLPSSQLELPTALESERALLGSLLLDGSLFPVVASIVRVDDFSDTSHRVLFNVLAGLDKKAEPFELASIQDDLIRSGKLQDSGGIAYIASLLQYVVTSAAAPVHAKRVHNAARERRIDAICAEGRRRVRQHMDPEGNELSTEEALGWLEAQIVAQQNEAISEKTRHVRDVATDVVDRIEKVANGSLAEGGILTHFADFDRLTAGLHPGQLVILAARPGEGKSTLKGNWCYNIAKGGPLHGEPRAAPCEVLDLSLEMTNEENTQRLLSPISGVPANDMRRRLDPIVVQRIAAASLKLGALPIYMDDTPSLLPSDIRAKIHLWRDKGTNPRVVFIDHLGLIQRPQTRRNSSTNDDIAEITKGLKSLAKDLGITIVLLCQMNRLIEKRAKENGKAPRPLLSDLRDSGAIEQDADVVLFIYRPDRKDADRPGEGSEANQTAFLIIAKQRNGPSGPTCDIPLFYNPSHCVFMNGGYQR